MDSTPQHISFDNPRANVLLRKLFSILQDGNSARFLRSAENEDGFYKFCFTDPFKTKCPFSLWISSGNGATAFFNLGDCGREAVVFHNCDITQEIVCDELEDFFNIFMTSFIQETRMYCRGRLKRIDYEIKGNWYGKYVYLAESYLFCFNKRKEMKIYERWG